MTTTATITDPTRTPPKAPDHRAELAYVPSLDVAVDVAQRALEDADQISFADEPHLAHWHLGSTTQVLRMLLAALATERGEQQ